MDEKDMELKGEGRESYIAASSVHSQRTEHLCQVVWNYLCYVGNQYYYVLQAIEAEC